MAGVYTDPLDERMAYDLDGCVLYWADNTTTTANVTQLSSGTVQALNDEQVSDGFTLPNSAGSSYVFGIIFPQLRNLTAYQTFMNSNSGLTVPTGPQYSTNTATGVDGTWSSWDSSTSVGTVFPVVTGGPPNPSYRTNVRQPTAQSSVKAVRWTFATTNATTLLQSLIVYGTIVSTQTPDRLRFWNPTVDQALSVTPALLDFGDVARGTTYTKSFRLKNNSSTLTANTITVSATAPTDASSPTNLSQISFSTDGGSTWNSTASITSLAPGVLSSAIIMRRVMSSTAVLGPWTQRLTATASTWT